MPSSSFSKRRLNNRVIMRLQFLAKKTWILLSKIPGDPLETPGFAHSTYPNVLQHGMDAWITSMGQPMIGAKFRRYQFILQSLNTRTSTACTTLFALHLYKPAIESRVTNVNGEILLLPMGNHYSKWGDRKPPPQHAHKKISFGQRQNLRWGTMTFTQRLSSLSLQ